MLEEIVEEYQMQKENKEIVLTLDFEEFEIFVKEDKNKFCFEDIERSTAIKQWHIFCLTFQSTIQITVFHQGNVQVYLQHWAQTHGQNQ